MIIADQHVVRRIEIDRASILARQRARISRADWPKHLKPAVFTD
jgi:hypothetical protein